MEEIYLVQQELHCICCLGKEDANTGGFIQVSRGHSYTSKKGTSAQKKKKGKGKKPPNQKNQSKITKFFPKK
ncbi:MAG: hypothetical protein GY861_29200 [bacterium]|nr:hypothetical protein [bacterium]